MLDTVATLKVDKAVAREKLREYHAAKAPRTAEDAEIMAAYKAIGRGQTIVDVPQSIRDAGWNADGTTKLAMTRADAERCEARFSDTEVRFSARSRGYDRARYAVRNMPARPHAQRWRGEAIVPLIPLPLRPKFALRNYWILWEADWKRVPCDPLLLRKLGGDLWLVLAAWDLSDVERAVLARRVATA